LCFSSLSPDRQANFRYHYDKCFDGLFEPGTGLQGGVNAGLRGIGRINTLLPQAYLSFLTNKQHSRGHHHELKLNFTAITKILTRVIVKITAVSWLVPDSKQADTLPLPQSRHGNVSLVYTGFNQTDNSAPVRDSGKGLSA